MTNKYSPEYQFQAACDAAGLTINGSGTGDPLHDAPKLYEAIRQNPFMALGETYSAGIIDVQNVGDMIYAFSKADMRGDLQKLLSYKQGFLLGLYYMFGKINLNEFKFGQQRIADDHYDLDNQLMVSTLGPSMKYTSAFYYPQFGEFDLDLFQKLDLEIAGRRMGLKPGDRLLDIGFGFGHNTKYLVERFGVHVTGLTISQEQKKFAEEVCKDVKGSVNFILSDRRKVNPAELGKFDHVCFFEMIESIGGPKNYLGFFKFIRSLLTDDGSVFGQVLTRNQPTVEASAWGDRSHATDPWIDKYIFKGGVLPRIGPLTDASEKAGLFPRLIDNSLGRANGETCKAWNNNFQRDWEVLRDTPDKVLNITLGEKYKRHFQDRFPYEMDINTFQRIWEYYLLFCEGGHRAGMINDGHYLWEANPEKVSLPDIDTPKTL